MNDKIIDIFVKKPFTLHGKGIKCPYIHQKR